MRFLKLLEFLFTARLSFVLLVLIAFGATVIYLGWSQHQRQNPVQPPAAQTR